MIEIDQCTVTLSEVRKDLGMKETRTEIMCVSFKKKKNSSYHWFARYMFEILCGVISIHQPETC